MRSDFEIDVGGMTMKLFLFLFIFKDWYGNQSYNSVINSRLVGNKISLRERERKSKLVFRQHFR